jgi:hypothetical protein
MGVGSHDSWYQLECRILSLGLGGYGGSNRHVGNGLAVWDVGRRWRRLVSENVTNSALPLDFSATNLQRYVHQYS